MWAGKRKGKTKPCVPSQSIPEDIPVTHTITFGVKPLETMNNEIKNTIITNMVPPPPKVINFHKYVDQKKENLIPIEILSASMVSAV